MLWGMWRYVIGGLIVLIAFVTCGKSSGSAPEDDFEVACRLLVKDRLKAPSTAQFSGGSGQIQKQSNGYRWAGTVDAQNSFGALIQSRFICTGTPERPDVTLF